MGLINSHGDNRERSFSGTYEHSQSSESFVDNSITGEPFIDFANCPISEDLLIEILSHVPAKDLILVCRLVCKEWKSLIDAQSIWRLKCDRENVKLPTRKFSQLPDHLYQYIYFYSTSKIKNLVKNPCGEMNLEHWIVTSIGSTGFAVENPPNGSDSVPEEVGSQSCFATTYMECAKHQTVNLKENHVLHYLLCHDLVKIKVGEWHAARFDCASEYRLKVRLYDDNKSIIDYFDYEYNEEQWQGTKWHLVTHEFDNVTNVSSVGFYHYGKDRQFWAGHYGSKMTGAFVELCFK